ncbi:MAG: MBL fold metallo-hydrolase, partial [Candidatus Baltobacteraceae bacterium]
MQTFAVGMLGCNCTVVSARGSGEAIVVDGGDGADAVMEHLHARGLRAKYLVHTHAHIDHIADVAGLRERTDARALLHAADLPLYENLALQASWLPGHAVPRIVPLDGGLSDGEVLESTGVQMRVLHTPGHTPGSVCFTVSEAERTTIFSGDTLFAGSIGRCDLGGTSMQDIVAS